MRKTPCLFVVILLLCLHFSSTGSAIADDVFDAWGFVQNRDFFSQLPYEHIDPLSGNLLLTFTDLVLPGNAGFDLRIQRTYNSKIYRSFSTLGDLLDEDSWAGIGWTMHLGRVLNPEPLGPGPIIEMPDGRRQRAYPHIEGSGAFITKEYWVYDANSNPPILKLPNGVTYSFGVVVAHPGIGNVRYVTQIMDAFGNRIDVEYGSAANAPPEGISRITQRLSNTVSRIVTFTYENATRRNLRTIQYTPSGKTHTWTYTHVATPFAGPQQSLLIEVKPPVGPSWKYAYNMDTPPRYELTRLTTPNGGLVDYTYETVQFFQPGTSTVVRSRAMFRRVTSGRDIVSGTWNFDYAQGSSRNRTIGTSPCGTTTYTFIGIGSGSPQLSAWQVGLLERKVLSDGFQVFEEEELGWLRSVAISNDDESVGFYSDSEIYAPLLERRTVTRGGRPFVTTNTYHATDFNDFGRPWRIDELGDLARTTTRVFRYGFRSYIVDKVASETVQLAGNPAVTKSYAYDLDNGFLESETIYGIRTTFTPDTFGNVESARNANNHLTRFTYAHGVLKDTITPIYPITRTISPNGTVASETRRGLTTRFEYDTLFRNVLVDPPAGNDVLTEFDNQNGAWSRIRRGLSVVTTDLDGFGRVAGTSNSVGIRTDAGWDACGRRIYESYPFAGNDNIGTAFQYDALGRLTRRANTGPNTHVTYAYSNGIDVTIVDEENRTTFQKWFGFGDPRDAWLVGVADAEGGGWGFHYNTLGQQILLDPPGASHNRQWTFNASSQLEREVHPESGVTTYTYDAAGNLKTRTDAAFGRTTYHYDANERLVRIDRPVPFPDILLAYDHSDNRTLLDNGVVRSTFAHDAANRLTRREDLIDGILFATGFDYDGNDNLARIAYSSGRTAQYSYDSENRITLVRDDSTTFATDFDYHPSGGVASFRAGNNILHTLTYDDRYRVEDLYDNAGVLDLSYTYDNVGNVRDIRDARPQMSQTYHYDNLDRLRLADGFWGSGEFTYDPLGNMRTKTVAGQHSVYTYDTSMQRLTSVSSPNESFTYGGNGNLIRDGQGAYTYTPENMLRTATIGSEVTRYDYDGDNLRKKKTRASETQYYVHGPGDRMLSEFEIGCDGVLGPLRDYIYAGSRLVASLSHKLNVPAPIQPIGTAPEELLRFEWKSVPGASRYHLIVETAEGAPLINEPNLTSNTYAPSIDLPPNEDYRWRVRATDGVAVTCFSEDTTFFLAGTPPNPITNLRVVDTGKTRVIFDWSAPPAGRRPIVEYDLRYSKSPLDASSFGTANQVAGEPSPAAPGTMQSVTVQGLESNTTYHFAIVSRDTVGSTSSLSNVVDVTTLDGIPPSAITDLAGQPRGGAVASLSPLLAIDASSERLATGFPKENAVDGNPSTFWSSTGTDQSVIEYITLDLGGEFNVGRVRLLSDNNLAKKFPKGFDIQMGNDPTSNFTTLMSFSGFVATPGTWYDVDVTPTKGRYVRILVTKKSLQSGKYWAQIAEVEVYQRVETPDGFGLMWTAPGDDGSRGTATFYDIRYWDQEIRNDNDFANHATRVDPALVATPKAAGFQETLSLRGFGREEVFWVAIKSSDELANVSALSNVVKVSTPGTPPGPVSGLHVVGAAATGTSIRLQWIAPPDDAGDPSSGPVARYDVRCSTAPIPDLAAFNSLPTKHGPVPRQPGETQIFDVPGLANQTTYYCGVLAFDEADLMSHSGTAVQGSTLDAIAPGQVTGLQVTAIVSSLPVAAVEVSGERNQTTFAKGNAIDGKLATRWSTPGRNQVTTEFITLDLGSVVAVSLVRLRASTSWQRFPKDFAIQLSTDGIGYTPVRAENDFTATVSTWYEFPFPATSARYVKIQVTEQRPSNGKYFTELAEVDVWSAEPNIVATLTWTATGDDGATGTAASYEIRFTTSPTDFQSATLAPNPPVPQPAGSKETFVMSGGLSAGAKTWFAIKTTDDKGNSSITVVSATMPLP
ncbi:MAG: discoidin domain-containing protein [Vicinamibacteria bacterium]